MEENSKKTPESPIATGAEGHFEENTAKTEPKTPEMPITTGADTNLETAAEGSQGENIIVYIAAGEIYQHPDNPRKDLGDLAELSESIKKKGIMQNLTVTPGHREEDGEWHEEGYTLLIGHRRCAAAGQAGIKKLPCRIVCGLSRKEQVAIMLEENMQRNDLTIYEQAQGFQMMLDLGETEESIAQKTGFSRTTVRHRLNIAKLDQEELQKKEQDENFQLTLKNMYELEKIKDVNMRNEVLKQAGDARQLVWKAQEAVRKEKIQENKKKFEGLFKKAGIRKAPKSAESERWSGKWEILQKWEADKDIPESLGNFGEGAMWVVFWGEIVAVIKPAVKEERKLSEYEIKQEERKKAKKELKQKHKAMHESMRRFILGITTGEIDQLKESVEFYRELLEAVTKAKVHIYEGTLAMVYAGKDLYDLKNKHPEEYEKFVEWKKSLTPAQEITAHMYEIEGNEMFNYNAEYEAESAAREKAAVGFLAKYGFTVSDEEQRMLDGTHELYEKKQEGDGTE